MSPCSDQAFHSCCTKCILPIPRDRAKPPVPAWICRCIAYTNITFLHTKQTTLHGHKLHSFLSYLLGVTKRIKIETTDKNNISIEKTGHGVSTQFVPNTRETVQECLMIFFCKSRALTKAGVALEQSSDKWSCAAVGESAVWRSGASKDIQRIYE